MSKPFIEQIHCPVCDALQTSVTWSSIDVGREPHLREKLFNGEINAFRCRQCGYAGEIVTPLLYEDSRRGFCVQYYPAEVLDDDEFIARMSSGRDESEWAAVPAYLREKSAYLLDPHIVFDADELLRYITFRERIGDFQHEAGD